MKNSGGYFHRFGEICGWKFSLKMVKTSQTTAKISLFPIKISPMSINFQHWWFTFTVGTVSNALLPVYYITISDIGI